MVMESTDFSSTSYRKTKLEILKENRNRRKVQQFYEGCSGDVTVQQQEVRKPLNHRTADAASILRECLSGSRLLQGELASGTVSGGFVTAAASRGAGTRPCSAGARRHYTPPVPRSTVIGRPSSACGVGMRAASQLGHHAKSQNPLFSQPRACQTPASGNKPGSMFDQRRHYPRRGDVERACVAERTCRSPEEPLVQTLSYGALRSTEHDGILLRQTLLASAWAGIGHTPDTYRSHDNLPTPNKSSASQHNTVRAPCGPICPPPKNCGPRFVRRGPIAQEPQRQQPIVEDWVAGCEPIQLPASAPAPELGVFSCSYQDTNAALPAARTVAETNVVQTEASLFEMGACQTSDRRVDSTSSHETRDLASIGVIGNAAVPDSSKRIICGSPVVAPVHFSTPTLDAEATQTVRASKMEAKPSAETQRGLASADRPAVRENGRTTRTATSVLPHCLEADEVGASITHSAPDLGSRALTFGWSVVTVVDDRSVPYFIQPQLAGDVTNSVGEARTAEVASAASQRLASKTEACVEHNAPNRTESSPVGFADETVSRSAAAAETDVDSAVEDQINWRTGSETHASTTAVVDATAFVPVRLSPDAAEAVTATMIHSALLMGLCGRADCLSADEDGRIGSGHVFDVSAEAPVGNMVGTIAAQTSLRSLTSGVKSGAFAENQGLPAGVICDAHTTTLSNPAGTVACGLGALGSPLASLMPIEGHSSDMDDEDSSLVPLRTLSESYANNEMSVGSMVKHDNAIDMETTANSLQTSLNTSASAYGFSGVNFLPYLVGADIDEVSLGLAGVTTHMDVPVQLLDGLGADVDGAVGVVLQPGDLADKFDSGVVEWSDGQMRLYDSCSVATDGTAPETALVACECVVSNMIANNGHDDGIVQMSENCSVGTDDIAPQNVAAACEGVMMNVGPGGSDQVVDEMAHRQSVATDASEPIWLPCATSVDQGVADPSDGQSTVAGVEEQEGLAVEPMPASLFDLQKTVPMDIVSVASITDETDETESRLIADTRNVVDDCMRICFSFGRST